MLPIVGIYIPMSLKKCVKKRLGRSDLIYGFRSGTDLGGPYVGEFRPARAKVSSAVYIRILGAVMHISTAGFFPERGGPRLSSVCPCLPRATTASSKGGIDIWLESGSWYYPLSKVFLFSA